METRLVLFTTGRFMDPRIHIRVPESCEFSERIGNNGAGDRGTAGGGRARRGKERKTGRRTTLRTSRTGNASGYSISRVKAHRAIGSGKTGVEITRERGPIRF